VPAARSTDVLRTDARSNTNSIQTVKQAQDNDSNEAKFPQADGFEDDTLLVVRGAAELEETLDLNLVAPDQDVPLVTSRPGRLSTRSRTFPRS
jgi:hypothetical protein